MNPIIQHMQRILRTLQDFGLPLESICFNESGVLDDGLEVALDTKWSTLYITTEQKDPYINLWEYNRVDNILYDKFSKKEIADILKTINPREEDCYIGKIVHFHFDQRGLFREITLDNVDYPDNLIKLKTERGVVVVDVLDAYPWAVKKLYDELKDGDYSTMEKTDAAIDRFIETALLLDITKAKNRSRLDDKVDEILRIIKETNGKNQDAEIKNALKRIEEHLAPPNTQRLLPEEEGLRQLYLQRINEGRFLLFQRYNLQFPYVLASNAELGGYSGRLVDRGLYFVAEDAAPEPWQKEVIAYHEYIESRKGHTAARRREIGLARDLGVPEPVFYSWRNALIKR